MITDISDYFSKGCGRCDRFATADCSVRKWVGGLQDLREICLGSGMVETVKWGHPCYMHAGRNIAVLGAFRGDFRLTFFNAALLRDPEGLLEKPGQNTLHPSVIRLSGSSRVADLAPVIRSYITEAMGYAASGIKPAQDNADMLLPDELTEAMATDGELAEAFHNLTQGRKKSYVIYLNAAKTAATRVARIAKFRPNILAGKGASER